MRTCPAPDCGTPIGHDFFLCPRHWRALELGQQVAVSAAFRRYKRARERGGTEELHDEALTPMSNDLVARLRAEAARLREQADSLEASAAILGGPAPRAKRAPGPKPKRSGEQRRPPSEGGKRAARRAEAEEKLRQLLKTFPEISAEAARLKLKLSWKLCKELLDEIRG